MSIKFPTHRDSSTGGGELIGAGVQAKSWEPDTGISHNTQWQWHKILPSNLQVFNLKWPLNNNSTSLPQTHLSPPGILPWSGNILSISGSRMKKIKAIPLKDSPVEMERKPHWQIMGLHYSRSWNILISPPWPSGPVARPICGSHGLLTLSSWAT